ncbi:RNA polymerase sigma factor SigZ [Acidaminobacter hydrogenoformans]|uniref:RNA polymerase sigma factor SigZ n=1 Tax=Acidaminobacter hydrogenoformans DSM 2784 TaxID=1120920 RepID=A0A1G5S135_9FIRM|nr:RNA polymerase sigma factor SigZ [Acidaminobacter hydrogenoformans]SCZ80074.1 RNA polymerase, sigma subunit, SigZ [Acidaminobacter hydrogenoformans DSM 2784]
MAETCVTCLWETLHEPLEKFIARRVSNPHDAEDLLQEVFVKISLRLDTLQDQDKLHSWIYQIARNVIIDYYRSGKTFEALPEDLVEGIGGVAEPSAEVLVVGGNANAEMANCLTGMIQRLPEKYREAIMLTEYENLTQTALAARLGLSVSGAKSRVQRGRKLLKEMMLDCCRLEFDRCGNIIDFQRYQPEKKC